MLYCTQWLIQCSISVIHHDTVSLWTSVIAGVKKKTRKHKRLLDQSIAGRAPCEATIAVIERHNSSTNWKPTATSTCWWIRGNYPMEQRNFLRQFSLFAKLRLSLHFRSAGILRLFFLVSGNCCNENIGNGKYLLLPSPPARKTPVDQLLCEILRGKPIGGFDYIRRVCSTVLHRLRWFGLSIIFKEINLKWKKTNRARAPKRKDEAGHRRLHFKGKIWSKNRKWTR